MNSLNSRKDSLDLRHGSDFKERRLPKRWVNPQSHLHIYSGITSEILSLSSWMRVFSFLISRIIPWISTWLYSRIFSWKSHDLIQGCFLEFHHTSTIYSRISLSACFFIHLHIPHIYTYTLHRHNHALVYYFKQWPLFDVWPLVAYFLESSLDFPSEWQVPY